MIAADGNVLWADHAARTVVATVAPTAGLREWLNMDGLCVAMRTDQDNHMRYAFSTKMLSAIARGTLSDLVYLCLSPR